MNTCPTPRVFLIMGSVRAGRHCPKIADWLLGIARQTSEMAYEIIDLKNWHLPADDEAAIPATGVYAHPHSRAWSEKITSADAIIIVSPQYNWGYPAALKNALDHLYTEWHGKPLMIVTYGGHGGSKCAQQLRQVADGLKMKPIETMPALTLTDEIIHKGVFDPEKDLAEFEPAVIQAIEELKFTLNSAA